MECPNCKNTSRIKKSFAYCPYCGQQLIEPVSLSELTARVIDLENRLSDDRQEEMITGIMSKMLNRTSSVYA